jgi:hypothetical protein
MELKVTLQGQVNLLNGLAQANQIAQAHQRETMLQALTLVQSDARQIVKKDTERLMGSIRPYLIEGGDSLIGVLEPMQPYGLPVERGRRAGRWPPFQPLAAWGSRHGFTTLHQIYLLRRAIARRGIKPAPFMLPAYIANRQRIIGLFAQVGQAVVTRIVRGT